MWRIFVKLRICGVDGTWRTVWVKTLAQQVQTYKREYPPPERIPHSRRNLKVFYVFWKNSRRLHWRRSLWPAVVLVASPYCSLLDAGAWNIFWGEFAYHTMRYLRAGGKFYLTACSSRVQLNACFFLKRFSFDGDLMCLLECSSAEMTVKVQGVLSVGVRCLAWLLLKWNGDFRLPQNRFASKNPNVHEIFMFRKYWNDQGCFLEAAIYMSITNWGAHERSANMATLRTCLHCNRVRGHRCVLL